MLEEILLSTNIIEKYIDKNYGIDNIFLYETIDSTNNKAKELAHNGCKNGTAVVAYHQSAGRGSKGRSFFSPKDTGIYMSLVLYKDELNITDITLITPITAVIVARVIEEVTGKCCGIKWVNDLYLDDKKVCGILTEGVMNVATGNIDRVVVGIGINVYTTDFPDDIKNVAASILIEEESKDIKEKIAAGIISCFRDENTFSDVNKIMNEYRRKQILIGKAVTVYENRNQYTAKVIDVDNSGRLIIQKEDGQREALYSGEVSVRQIDNIVN